MRQGGTLAVLALAACAGSLTGPPARAEAQPAASAHLAALSAPADVVWDTLGVPHIRAGSVRDAYVALGWTVAHDRLWQLDQLRRSVNGTGASLLGNGGLRQDGFIRLLGVDRWADSTAARLDPTAFGTRAIDAFTDGVNAYLASVKPLPREYRALGKRPRPWKRSDSVALVLGYGLTLDFETSEIERAKDREKTGLAVQAAAGRYEPFIRYDTIEGTTTYGPARTLGALSVPPAPGDDERGASNAWVVAGARTASGRPLLANDPHLDLADPPVWFAVHLFVPDTLDAAGVMVPGVPTIISGRNRHVAWGITALEADAVDYTTEILSRDGRRYLADDGWRPLGSRSLHLHARLGPLSVPLGIHAHETRHGPLLLTEKKKRRGYAVRWAPLLQHAFDPGSIGLERARSASELRDFVRHIQTPTLNVVAADDGGHIAYQTVGAVPVRAAPASAVPKPGWDAGAEWVGWIPVDSMPAAIDPARGYFVSANNRPTSRGAYLAAYSQADFRARRIAELLDSLSAGLGVGDMARIQMDVESPEAREWLDVMLDRTTDSTALTPLAREALGVLARWDRRADAESAGETIFRAWLNELQRELPSTRSRGLLTQMLREQAYEEFWDDPGTPVHEARATELSRALTRASAALAERFGDEPASWAYGPAHRAHFVHSLEKSRAQFTGPTIGAPGDPHSIAHGSSGLPRRTTYGHGVSWRMIVDLAEPDVLHVILPPGNSGEIGSRFATNMLARWARGEYATLRLAIPEGPERAEAVTLTP